MIDAVSAPALGAVEVTPSDATDLSPTARALYVGGAGTLEVIMQSGDTVTFTNAEGVLPIRVKRVLATGTTATGIVALY